jgi:Histidine kinase-, DNA gyrase B-, and HSP90-like ATPase
MSDQIQFRLGLDTISSYKRLDYSPWHAIAEFVDNSTQSFFDNEETLRVAHANEDDGKLRVDVAYDRDNDLIRVSDNAMGMSRDELDCALEVGARPANTSGRSKYGMGMKTAACWLGNEWTVRTKKLGETVELQVTVNVEKVASGDRALPTRELPDQDPEAHYTVIEITKLNRPPRGQTFRKIKDFLSSMYRQDLKDGILDLRWQGEKLSWEFPDELFLHSRDGTPYKRKFIFEVGDKVAEGWVGILERGSRAKAGFSILHAGRVVKGWPESWRPSSIYGQYQGSNDLINQRVVGEIELDDFEVTHTKDDILWFGEEEEEVETKLFEEAADYLAVAKHRRKGDEGEGGPSELEVKTAIEELEAELSSSELADLITVEDVPPPEAVAAAIKPIVEAVADAAPDFSATIGNLTVSGFTEQSMSPNDPYVVADSSAGEVVVVVVNMRHPHVGELEGVAGMLNYLRHCVYDAIAEWQARRRTTAPDPHTVKMLKDRLLRVSMEIEMHAPDEIAVP